MRSVRLLAFFLDLSIAHFCYRFWAYLLIRSSFDPGVPTHSSYVAPFPVYEPFFLFLYFWISIGLSTSTPAMSLLGIRVLRDDDRKSSPGMLWAFSRTFFFFLSVLPFGLGAWISLLSPSGKTLYDCLSQTRVFWEKDSAAVSSGVKGSISDHALE